MNIERELLKKIRRDLDACQRVIWLAGGFDPAYCSDAQECLKEIDKLLEQPDGPNLNAFRPRVFID